MRLLIIEDETALAQSMRHILQQEGYEADIADNGKLGLALAVSEDYAVIILDLMLPGMDGMTLLSRLRKASVYTPVIILSAKAEVKDKVAGLDMGASYYLTKPFDFEELFACIRASLRGAAFTAASDISFGDTTLNTSFAAVSHGEKTIKLAEKEFEILKMLIRAGGGIVSNKSISLKLWNSDTEANKGKIEVYISILRKKLAFIQSGVSIKTARKKGYYLEKNA